MKIGIITQPLHANYGGLLQNYALQQTLIRSGHDVITIDQDRPQLNILEKIKVSLILMLAKCLGRAKYKKFPLTEYEYIKRGADVIYFKNKYINSTLKCTTYEELNSICTQLVPDVLIVGSDQVWRPRYSIRPESAFLDFYDTPNVIKIAYAASFGTDTWEYTEEQTSYIKKYIQKFIAISVREKPGIQLCKDNLDVDACQVVDPTLLLDRIDYIKLVESENEHMSEGNLLTYILDNDDNKQKIIRYIASELQLKDFSVMVGRKRCSKFPSVTKWLRGFMDAKFAIVDSFHGTVFSIIFNKPFIVIANSIRGNSRFDTLLSTFNLQDRIISSQASESEILTIIRKDIDWNIINSIWLKKKEEGINFLKKALECKRN